jgi:hypothetical protein
MLRYKKLQRKCHKKCNKCAACLCEDHTITIKYGTNPDISIEHGKNQDISYIYLCEECYNERCYLCHKSGFDDPTSMCDLCHNYICKRHTYNIDSDTCCHTCFLKSIKQDDDEGKRF